MIEQNPVLKTTKNIKTPEVGTEQRQTLPKGSAAFAAALEKAATTKVSDEAKADAERLVSADQPKGVSDIVVSSQAQADMIQETLAQAGAVSASENVAAPEIELVSDENMQIDAVQYQSDKLVDAKNTITPNNDNKLSEPESVDEALVEEIQAMMRPEEASAEMASTVSVEGVEQLGQESKDSASATTGQDMKLNAEETKAAAQQAALNQELANKEAGEKQPKSDNAASEGFTRQMAGRDADNGQGSRSAKPEVAQAGQSQTAGQQSMAGQQSGQQLGQQGQSNQSSQQSVQQQVMDQLNKQQLAKTQQTEVKQFADAVVAEEKRVERSERLLGGLGFDSRAQLPAQMQSIGYGVRTPQFGQAFGNRVVYMANNKVQEAKITLNPEKLGPIQIKLNVDKEQQVHVSVVAQHGTTREALESAMPRLKEMMESAGMEFGSFDVRDDQAFADNQQGDGAGAKGAGNSSGEDVSDDTDGSPIVQVSSNNLVDYYA